MQPSLKARIQLLEQNKDRIDIVSWRPYDPPECICEHKVNKQAKSGSKLHFECPRDKKGLRKYRVLCKSCGDMLAYFYAARPKLKDYCDLHYTSWFNKDSWHGCLGLNINAMTSEIRFECCCGNKAVEDRYTRYKISIYKNGK